MTRIFSLRSLLRSNATTPLPVTPTFPLCDTIMLHGVFSFLTAPQIISLECLSREFQRLVRAKAAQWENVSLNYGNCKSWLPSPSSYLHTKMMLAAQQTLEILGEFLFGKFTEALYTPKEMESVELTSRFPEENFQNVSLLQLFEHLCQAGIVLWRSWRQNAYVKQTGSHLGCTLIRKDSSGTLHSIDATVQLYFHPCKSRNNPSNNVAIDQSSRKVVRVMSFLDMFVFQSYPSCQVFSSNTVSFFETRQMAAVHEMKMWERREQITVDEPRLLPAFDALALSRIVQKHKYFVVHALSQHKNLPLQQKPVRVCSILSRLRRCRNKVHQTLIPADLIYPQRKWMRLSLCATRPELQALRNNITSAIVSRLYSIHQLHDAHSNCCSENILINVPSLEHLTDLSTEQKRTLYMQLVERHEIGVIFEDPIDVDTSKIYGVLGRTVLFARWSFWEDISDDAEDLWDNASRMDDLFALFFVLCDLFQVKCANLGQIELTAIVDMSSGFDYYKLFVLPVEFARQRGNLPWGIYQWMMLMIYLLVDTNNLSTMTNDHVRWHLLTHKWRCHSWGMLRQRLLTMLFDARNCGENATPDEFLCKQFLGNDPRCEVIG